MITGAELVSFADHAPRVRWNGNDWSVLDIELYLVRNCMNMDYQDQRPWIETLHLLRHACYEYMIFLRYQKRSRTLFYPPNENAKYSVL